MGLLVGLKVRADEGNLGAVGETRRDGVLGHGIDRHDALVISRSNVREKEENSKRGRDETRNERKR